MAGRRARGVAPVGSTPPCDDGTRGAAPSRPAATPPREPAMRATPAVLAVLVALAAPLARSGEFTPNRLFVAAQADDRVMIYDGHGFVRGAIGAATTLSDPAGIAFGPDGLLYVLSAGSGDVQVFGPDPGGALDTFGSGLVDPAGIAFDPRGRLAVGDGGTDRVLLFAGGVQVGTVGDGAGLAGISALAFDADGHLFVACTGTSRVHEFDPSGVEVAVLGAGSGIAGASGLALGSDGRLYVSSRNGDSIVVLDPSGTKVDELAESSGLSEPGGLAFGPDGRLAVVSRGTDEVLLIDVATDTVEATVGKSLGGPTTVAWSPFRFAFSARGRAVGGGVAGKAVHKGALSVAPGSGLLMLALDPQVEGGEAQVLVLSGFEQSDAKADRRRGAQGTALPASLAIDGMGSLALLLSGKVDTAGLFHVKKAKGSFVRHGPDGVFVGSAGTGKKLK